jgi:chorismate synthase
VAEATVAYVLANAFLDKYGGDTLPALRRHYRADQEAE